MHINQSLSGTLQRFFEDIGGGCRVQSDGFRMFVVMIDIVFNGGNQFDHGSAKNSAPQAVRGEGSPKKAFDHVERMKRWWA